MRDSTHYPSTVTTNLIVTIARAREQPASVSSTWSSSRIERQFPWVLLLEFAPGHRQNGDAR